MSNLKIAFPQKTEEDRIRIAKDFYKNFLDTFIETIKFFSLSDKGFAKRFSGNFEIFKELYESGQSVQMHSGHFFNWEYMNWGIARNSPYPLLGVYAPMSNKAVDKLMYKMRSRYNTILINAYTFRTSFHQYSNQIYSLGLAADQNPPSPEKSYWVNFFGKRTAFYVGPEKGARVNNTAVVFVHFYKVKRGYYKADFQLITTEPKSYLPGQLTKQYVGYLEECIRKTPSNYLWSHRRWKHEFKEEFRNNLID